MDASKMRVRSRSSAEKLPRALGKIDGGRSLEVAPALLEGGERKKERKGWGECRLLAHAARIAKPTLRVVTIGVGVVATPRAGVVGGGFEKGVVH